MKSKHFLKLMLPFLACCFMLTASAQEKEKTEKKEPKEVKTKTNVNTSEGDMKVVTKKEVEDDGTKKKLKAEGEDTEIKSVTKEKDGEMESKDKVVTETEDGKVKIVTKTDKENGEIEKKVKIKADGEKVKFKTEKEAGNARMYPYTWTNVNEVWYDPKMYSYQVTYGGQTMTRNPGMSSTDREPILVGICSEAADKSQCTKNYLQTKFYNVYYPGLTYPQNYGGVEYVIFNIDETGKVDSYSVARQSVNCPDCAQVAVNMVGEAGDWLPATYNGIPVKTTLAIPVRFNMSVVEDR